MTASGYSEESVTDGLSFNHVDKLAAVRRYVRTMALGLGLHPDRTERLVLAVSELAANALLYTPGGGYIQLWSEGHQVVCELIDTGGTRSFGDMPPAHALGGRGLAIVSRMVDSVSAEYSGRGAVIRLRMAL